MLIINTETIPGKEWEPLGLVKGSTIQSKHIGKDIGASLKTVIGGELKSYTKMMNEAREIATNRMLAEAQALGADAIVNVRFTTSSIMQGAAEVMAYGTAVRLLG
ncbi:MAG: heavy metal-binding domain-containing protein [Clostridia bacterium]|nr:heavy metal-binding domain-containing protein [Clostridia bacterium]